LAEGIEVGVASREFNMSNVTIIAEAGVNHNGDVDRALEMVDVAADAGADAVKFQTFSADSVIAPGTPKAEYQQRSTGDGDQLEMVRRLQLNYEQHARIANHCRERGIEFLSTPFDEWAISILAKLNVRRFKVASGEITNRPLLEAVARQCLPIILSTGMSSLQEIRSAIDWVEVIWGRHATPSDLTLLHCTSNYPAAPADVNLRAMVTMRDRFQLPVGYSDHTLGVEVSLAAVALGATVIEKHFTLDRCLPGPDHAASLDPGELRELVSGVRVIGAALGDGIKRPTASEEPIRRLVRRSAFASRHLPSGHVLTRSDLIFLRPGVGIGPELVDRLEGRILARGVEAGRLISWDDLS
jgi:N,N'-diacetyllegionaminate synthase